MIKRKFIIYVSCLVVLLAGGITFALTRPPHFNLDQLHITISPENYSILEGFRETAMDNGHLDRSPNDYVGADFSYNTIPYSGKLRLKGDYLDHLKEDKWSFRIKLSAPMSDGLQVFSVQNPESRDFLNSYVFHHLLKEEGVLSNEFRFVELFVNGDTWGIYCLEEHLTSRLISHQNKPNGVLLKFTDDSFFAAEKESNTDGLIKQAKIKVYGDSKKDKAYKKDVKLAKSIIKDYQFGHDTAFTYFDTKSTGKYYALCDLGTAYHAMGWINIRFYFNFETQKMEPVGYDAYPVLEWGKPYLGRHYTTLKLDPFETKMIVYNALQNKAIRDSYFEALHRVTTLEYVTTFMSKHTSQLEFLEQEIQKEYNYAYNYNFITDRAKEIRAALEE